MDRDVDLWTDGLNKYILNAHYTPGSSLNSGNTAMNKTKPVNK